MESNDLRNELVGSLRSIYGLRAFGALADLLQGEALVLEYLAQHREETVCPSALSDSLHLSRPRVTGALNSLRRKGCITLEHSERDRRRVHVRITQAGLTRIAAQVNGMMAYFDRMLAGLGDADARTLIRLMDRCVEIMGE